MTARLLTAIEELPRRVAVVATSIVTYCAMGAALATIVASTLGDAWPRGAAIALQVAGLLGAIVACIRRVTPVDKPERGLLPTDEPAPRGGGMTKAGVTENGTASRSSVTTPDLEPLRHYICPRCEWEHSIRLAPTKIPMHPCAGAGGLTMPLVLAGNPPPSTVHPTTT